MSRGKRGLAVVASALLAAVATAGTAQQTRSANADFERLAQAELDKLPNTPGDGPYPAMIETDPTLPHHVIYRPADLSPFEEGKLSVLVWGNGACADDGTAHRLHLAEIASYGYLVIAPGDWRSGPGATAPQVPQRAQPQTGLLVPATTAQDVRAGLDWSLAEDRREGGKYRGKIRRDAIAVAGHSCGGLQAMELAADARVKAVLIHNSGIFNDGKSPIEGIAADKRLLQRFHTPVIYILGGATDIAYANGTDDFARLKGPAALVNLPVGHGGTFSEPMGGAVAHVAVDWLEWQLKGDSTAARTFIGENCRLCSGTKWTIQRKGM